MSARPTPRLVAVGASAGGVEALQELVAGLPRDLKAAVLVVLHVPPSGISVLPQILSRAGAMPATHARNGETIQNGHVYCAPPDYHLRVRDGHAHVVRGPRENGHRPAVDPLFRTAARSFGAELAAVILSGSLDDGTLGLAAVKAAGGTTIVQDPEEALYAGMPRSAIERVGPDYVMRVSEIAELIRSIVSAGPDGGALEERGGGVSAEEETNPDLVEPVGNPSGGEVSRYTCPECRGTLWELREGGLIKLRCRVGHAYTEDAYAAEKSASLEAAIWTALQTLEEKADFAKRLAARFDANGQKTTAKRYEEQRQNALAQAELVRQALADLDLSEIEPEERQAS